MEEDEFYVARRARETLGDLGGDGWKIYEYVIYAGVSCEGVS
jgi:hypothetical protein